MDIQVFSNSGTNVWYGLAAIALLVAAVILAAKAIEVDKRTATITYAAAAILCLAAFAGFVADDTDRRSDAKKDIVEGFSQTYGLQLGDSDIRHLDDVEWKDVTRNLETADGSLKQVLFRVVDDKVQPYTMDVAGSWTPMQVIGDAL